jgi:putative OPT family oligopeptide transporter
MNPAPQLTIKAVILSVLLAAILTSANAYVGLFAGLTVATAIPAAVISMAVLPLFGKPNILENNIVATGASAGTSISAGAIFTLPALVLMHHWTEFPFWWTFAVIGFGGLLGVLFSVPLRRSLILEEKLRFPEGVAAAAVLKVAANPTGGAKLLAGAGLLAGAFKFLTSGLRILPEDFVLKGVFGTRTYGYLGCGFAPALIGVGYIVGLNIGVFVLVGAVLGWWVANPIYSTFFFDHDPVLAAKLSGVAGDVGAIAVWRYQVRYIGVGCMLAGAAWAIWALRKSLVAAVKSGLKVSRTGGGEVPHTERDMPMGMVLTLIALFVIPLGIIFYLVTSNLLVAFAMAVIMIIAGFLFSAVSGYMAGLVGSSSNPVSGITICTILFASVVLIALMGRNAAVGGVAVLFIAAVVCTAAAIAGDNLQDLKAGELVGATPWRQQVMLCIGSVAGAVVMSPVLNALQYAYGIGEPSHPGKPALAAPQANLLKSVAEGMFGGHLPFDMISIGLVVGAVVIAFDQYLKRTGAKWGAPIFAVSLGIYLPMDVSMPIFVGSLVAAAVSKFHAARSKGGEDDETQKQGGMLFAAGLITGEALIGIIIAFCITLAKNPDVLDLKFELPLGQWVAALILLACCYLIYRAGTPRKAT